MSTKTSIHDMPIVYPEGYDSQKDGWNTHRLRGGNASGHDHVTKIVGDDTFHPANASSGADYLFTDEYLDRIESGELA